MKCRFEENGCRNVVKLGSLVDHETKCEFNYTEAAAAKISILKEQILNRDKIISDLEAKLNAVSSQDERSALKISNTNLLAEIAKMKTLLKTN